MVPWPGILWCAWSRERHTLPYNNNTLFISFLTPVDNSFLTLKYDKTIWKRILDHCKTKETCPQISQSRKMFFQGDESFCSLLDSWSAVVFRVRLTGRTHHGTRKVTNLNLTPSPAAKTQLQNAVSWAKRKTSTKTWVWQLFPPVQGERVTHESCLQGLHSCRT